MRAGVLRSEEDLRPERNALGPKIIEACECLRWWWRNGVLTGLPTVTPRPSRAEVEARTVSLLEDTAIGDDDPEDLE